MHTHTLHTHTHMQNGAIVLIESEAFVWLKSRHGVHCRLSTPHSPVVHTRTHTHHIHTHIHTLVWHSHFGCANRVLTDSIVQYKTKFVVAYCVQDSSTKRPSQNSISISISPFFGSLLGELLNLAVAQKNTQCPEFAFDIMYLPHLSHITL